MRPALLVLPALLLSAQSNPDLTPIPWDGYRGIWYMNQPTDDEHKYKYSGGFATYPQQHVPIAVYSRDAQKTFFVLGGVDGRNLVHLVGFYDHSTHRVSRPVRLLNKKTDDAHDNPVLSLDAAGHLYVFSSAHGASRPSYLWRSRKPHDIAEWDLLRTTNFSYPQPWFLPGAKQFLFLHTLYSNNQRGLHIARSADARSWSGPEKLAHIDMGDYQVSWRQPGTDRVATIFDMHPSTGRAGKGLNYRTNIYYLETSDAGRTFTTLAGQPVILPLTETNNPALALDFLSKDLNVYIKDLDFQPDGHPVFLFLTSKGYQPGPASGPFQWHTARWTGSSLDVRSFTTSDHNYDHGSLYIEQDNLWRIIAPTDPGPQPHGTGGGMVMWISRDQGQAWKRQRTLTPRARFNHTYARKPVDAQPDFYSIWADGNPLAPSESSIYFCTRDGNVFRLPERFTTPTAKPLRVN